MSIKININELKDREKIHKDLTLYNENKNEEVLTYFIDENDDVFLPFHYAIHSLKLKRRERTEFSQRNIVFTESLRPYQESVKNDAIDALKNASIILSLYTGFGKTCLAIYLSSIIKMKTLILTHRLLLIDQWKNSINKFCPNSKVQILKPRTAVNHNCDFYIANGLNISKIGHEDLKDIGLLIVDEVHVFATQILGKSLNYISPRYLIGLSATPYRSDGMDKLLDLFFGEIRISKELYHTHNVYRILTPFIPEIKYMYNGKMDWNHILFSQCRIVERNDLILDILSLFKNRTFLVLCKRVEHSELLKNLIKERLNEESSVLSGKNNKYNENHRILLATVSKVGLGFSHNKLDSLIVAGDVEEYFIQYLGRVFRTEEVVPYIFDIIDNNSVLKNHYYRTRKGVYEKSGGTIYDFWKEFPSMKEKYKIEKII